MTCLECAEGLQLNNDGECLETCDDCTSCPETYFPSGSTCLSCSPGCRVCAHDSECVECLATHELADGGCTSKVECTTGQVLSGKSCLACPANCQQCSESLQCLYCQLDFKVHLGECTSSCPPATYIGETHCQPCSGCQICDGPDPADCLDCRYDHSCDHECPDHCSLCSGGFCLLCDPNYLLSLSANQCSPQDSECLEGQYLHNHRCKGCPQYCRVCQQSFCQTCYSPYVSHFGACRAYCPSSYYQLNGECRQCHS